MARQRKRRGVDVLDGDSEIQKKKNSKGICRFLA